MEPRLMAIWKYDTPPFYNGGEIERITQDGMVVPKGYDGCCFNPVKILPLDELKLRELKDMFANYSQDIKDISSGYKHKAELLFGIVGHK